MVGDLEMVSFHFQTKEVKSSCDLLTVLVLFRTGKFIQVALDFSFDHHSVAH